jgi:DNA polymerase III epsilon subunit-like protein
VNRFLALDTEIGGFDPQTDAIISLGAVVWEGGHEVAAKEWVICDPEGRLNAGALAVNGFSEDIIRSTGAGPLTAWLDFQGFVHAHVGTDPRFVVPVGHNIAAFDIPFIQRLARIAGEADPKKAVEDLIGRRPIDTMVIARFYQYVGIFPSGKPVALSALLEKYLPHLGPQLHTAVDDARRTAMILDKLEDELHHTIDGVRKFHKEGR